MAKVKYLDNQGLVTLVSEIKKRTSNMYNIKGAAIYADQEYVDSNVNTSIDTVGLWQISNGVWSKITAVKPGWVYNVINDFTTDADFVEGAGIKAYSGVNIVAVNTGSSSVPVMKWDVLATSTDMSVYQTRALDTSITVFSNETQTVYTSDDDLPLTEAKASAEITDGIIAVISGDIYRATVTEDDLDATKNNIVWTYLGNQRTVEGLLELLSTVSPNTPITDAEIIAAFND